ncbi:hypothetical protein Q7P37_000483 [Cladosporium fusiforme]
MLAHTILALGALTLSSVSAQSQSICQASPYKGLGCLASNTAAIADCTSRLPIVSSTTTSTTSVLSEITESPRAKTLVKSQETVSSTSFETTTETVTCTAASTSYSPVIQTECITSTITTYTSPTPSGQRQKRQATSAACVSSGLESLSSFNNETLADACSCLDIPALTEISTVYVTSFIAATTTSFQGLAPTTTAEFIDRVTVTETVSPYFSVIPVSSTKTITETSTVSLAAPTYKEVFGPEAGCSSLNAGLAEALDASITEECEADKACQEICSQEPSCKFLYVQRLVSDYGGAAPYYQCYMDPKEFDEDRDLVCGRDEKLYGEARGFDACGRGTEA